jgi:hypothetical protein
MKLTSDPHRRTAEYFGTPNGEAGRVPIGLGPGSMADIPKAPTTMKAIGVIAAKSASARQHHA